MDLPTTKLVVVAAASGVAVGFASAFIIISRRQSLRKVAHAVKSRPLPDPLWKAGQGGMLKPPKRVVTIIPSSLPAGKSLYALLISAVTPRPIAFVSTISSTGSANLAPFSFFGLMCHDPPTLAFCTVYRGGKPKDTLANLRESGECVVNMISEDFVEAANCCCGEYPPEVDEFELSGLTKVPSVSLPRYSPPRVGEAKVQMECRVTELKELIGREGKPTATMITCEIVAVHLHESVHRKTAQGSDYVDHESFRPVGRLGGNDYGTIAEIFSMDRPPSDAEKVRGKSLS